MKSKDQYTWELAQIDKGNLKSKAVKAKRQALLEEARQDGFIWKESVGFIAITADMGARKASVTPLNNGAQAQAPADALNAAEPDIEDLAEAGFKADALMPKDNAPDSLPDLHEVLFGPIPSDFPDESARAASPNSSQRADERRNFVSVKKAPQSIKIASREHTQEARPETIRVNTQQPDRKISGKGYGNIAGY